MEPPGVLAKRSESTASLPAVTRFGHRSFSLRPFFDGPVTTPPGAPFCPGVAVVNVHVAGLASGLPRRSRAWVVTVAVYWAPAASGAAGVSVQVMRSDELTLAATGAPPPTGVRKKVCGVTVVGSIRSENVAMMAAPDVATWVAFGGGVVEAIVGGVTSTVGSAVTAKAS